MSLDLKIAIAQVNPAVGDLAGNGRKVIEYAGRAKALGADVVVFPEQVVTGYPAQDLLLHPDFIRDVTHVNREVVRNIEGITAIVGTVEPTLPGPDGKALQNVALAIRDRELVGRQAKTLLPEYDVFYERRYFTPAAGVTPIDISGHAVGIEICEDMWDAGYARKVTKELVEQGAEAILEDMGVKVPTAERHMADTGTYVPKKKDF
jgi:NAD+ synthase (glutamine-hydrolysing)